MNRVSDYFDLREYSFAELFEGIENVWEAIPRIKEILKGRKEYSIECEIPEGAWIENRETISIGEGSRVEPGAMIIGPALIGKNCTIRQGAYLRGNVVAGDGCVIGHTTEVKNSIFMNGAKAAHFAYVGDSILGKNVNLGAGTKLANLKMETGSSRVIIKINGKNYDTGMRKLGAVIGDGAEMGCNSVSAPGTLIGPGSIVYPCTLVRGVVPPGSIVKLKQELEIAELNVS